ncbi:hypothetical protein HK405_011382, partial [Cladochytrium tenue]
MDHVSTDAANNGGAGVGLGHDSAVGHGGVEALNPALAAAADVSTVLADTSFDIIGAGGSSNDTTVPLIAPQPSPQPQPPAPANDNAAISPGSSSSDGGAAIEQPPVSVLPLPLPQPQVEQAPVSTPVEPVDPAGDAVLQPPASPVGQGVAEVPATRQVVVHDDAVVLVRVCGVGALTFAAYLRVAVPCGPQRTTGLGRTSVLCVSFHHRFATSPPLMPLAMPRARFLTLYLAATHSPRSFARIARNGPQVEFAYPQFPGCTRPEGDSFEADGSRSIVELPDAWSFLPILGSVRTKLGLVTQALFAQRDFSRLDLLE